MIGALLPGRLRPPPLLGTVFFDPVKWQNLKNKWGEKIKGGERGRGREGEEGEKGKEEVRVWGSDRNEGAIEVAKRNAKRAGVEKLIEFSVCGVGRSPWLVGEGGREEGGEEGGGEGGEGGERERGGGLLVATNPPYGKRISAKKDLLPLYQTLGERVKRLRERRREGGGEGGEVGVVVVGKDVGLMRRMGVGFRGGFTTQHGGLTVTAMVSREGEEGEKKKGKK